MATTDAGAASLEPLHARSLTAPAGALLDEHSVLLWQTCAYVDDLTAAARSKQRMTPAHDAMLEFLHYRLLPYLDREERQLPSRRLRGEHMAGLLLADHQRLRLDVGDLESSRTRRLLTGTTGALVERLDAHVRREDAWVIDPAAGAVADADGDVDVDVDVDVWALPLLFGHQIDRDALPIERADLLVLQRLARMRRGETVRVHASRDMQPLWRRQHACDPGSHVWVYEQDGPTDWLARITRRDPDGR